MRKLALLLALAGGVLIGCGEKGEMVAPAPPMIRVDTVVVVDTIVRVDTVVVVDTIVRVDTVTVTSTRCCGWTR
ncbi:hypothetical protein [Candidatus Palauibacter sp.]|uniref:hypothetical protein n=1 Tax=Candidatus Palauibacter sp. TaxID=3101350 RepID=UPI003B01CDF9